MKLPYMETEGSTVILKCCKCGQVKRIKFDSKKLGDTEYGRYCLTSEIKRYMELTSWGFIEHYPACKDCLQQQEAPRV